MSHPPQGTAGWTAAHHEAYLDSRPDPSSPYNPAAEYGDPDWREPASDDEAAARTTWLAEHTQPAPGWQRAPGTEVDTEVDQALDAARERAVHSDWAHDHDPYAWAEHDRLQALAALAPLPEHDALDDVPRTQRGEPDTAAAPDGFVGEPDDPDGHDDLRAGVDRGSGDDPVIDTQGRWWPSTTAWVVARADPAKAQPSGHPDDLDRLRARMENLRAQLAARDAADAHQHPADEAAGMHSEQRRQQLVRWHDDDHRPEGADLDLGRDSGDGPAEAGWGR